MAKKIISDIERLFKHIEICIDSCWIWTGPLERDGYARQIKIGSRTDNSRRMARPHRLMYEAHVGLIPEAMTIDHLCRRRCCINPDHLDVVSQRENTQRGYRGGKLYCRSGHALFGQNLGFRPHTGFRFCKTCQRAWTRRHYRKTGGAAQKRYAAENKEKRRLDTALRRARKKEKVKSVSEII